MPEIKYSLQFLFILHFDYQFFNWLIKPRNISYGCRFNSSVTGENNFFLDFHLL